MKVAVIQSNYIPWKGYFDIINSVDLFIFHDDVQYTTGDWRNRNKIKTPNGLEWLTIPCGSNTNRLICEVELKDSSWQKKHWAKIEQNYNKAKCFKEFKEFFKEIYLATKWKNLSELNQYLIKHISKEILGIKTTFDDSRNYNLSGKKQERLLELLKKVKTSYYLSGPAAKSYINEELFKQEGIEIEWMDYGGYPEYNQLYPPFEHAVSIIDLILNEGYSTPNFMKSFKNLTKGI